LNTKALLNNEVQEFIRNFKGDVSSLAFSGSPFKNVATKDLIQQIEGRQKVKSKLPKWFKAPNILFPPKLNLEQTSSAQTAQYKASIVAGKSIADITGGFGVDSYYFSEKFKTVYHFEINNSLAEIAKHNFEIFNKSNVTTASKNGLEAALANKFDVIYADPSRRHESKGKVFFLKDCEPNIPENIEKLLDNCEVFLLKTSPMLDISVGLNELKHVFEIHIVAVENEVKELLWLLKQGANNCPKIKTVNLRKDTTEEFDFQWGQTAEASYNLPQTYLFEPNAALLKSGAFSLISEKLKVEKLHKNTHLYTSDRKVNFPGRIFKIEKVIPYAKSDMRRERFTKANIATRNFPESVATIRKKWKVGEGGEVYLFFTTNVDNKKVVVVCSKE